MGRHIDKVRASAEQAVASLPQGASVMVGGFGLCGNAEALIAAVAKRGIGDLWLISNNAGNLGQGLATWLQAGLVRKVTCSYIGQNQDLHQQMSRGQVEVEVLPQGTFVERMRAGGAGIAAFYTPTGVGTQVAEGKETRFFAGREYVLEEALTADYALIRAHRGDPFGNLRFRQTTRNFSLVMATAARTTLAEVDKLVELGEIAANDVHLPGIFVHEVVEVSEHQDPFEHKKVRPPQPRSRSAK